MVTSDELKKLTAEAKRLVRSGMYTITRHAVDDHPEREITAADILECLKIGSAVDLEPRVVNGETKYMRFSAQVGTPFQFMPAPVSE